MPNQPEPYKMPWALPEESPNKPATVPLQEVAQAPTPNQPIPPQPNKGGHSAITVIIFTIVTFIFSLFFFISAAVWVPLFIILFGIDKVINFNGLLLAGTLSMLIFIGPIVTTTLVAFFMSRPAKVQSSTSNATIETSKEKPSTLNKKFLISVGIVLILLLLLLSLLISF